MAGLGNNSKQLSNICIALKVKNAGKTIGNSQLKSYIADVVEDISTSTNRNPKQEVGER